MICCNIKVIDPSTGSQIFKNDKQIIEGRTSGIAVTRVNSADTKDTVTLSCKTKLEFNDCSYHFKKMYFALRCEYYLPSEPEHPLVVATSAPFKVYARRFKQRRGSDSSNEEYVEDSPPHKKIRRSNNKQQPTFTQYEQLFEELIAYKDKLSPEERKMAIDLAIKRLLPAEHLTQPYLPTGNGIYEQRFHHSVEAPYLLPKPQHVGSASKSKLIPIVPKGVPIYGTNFTSSLLPMTIPSHLQTPYEPNMCGTGESLDFETLMENSGFASIGSPPINVGSRSSLVSL